LYLGTCNRWDRHRAFGFVRSDSKLDGIEMIFSHKAHLPHGVDHLEQGARVEFELVPAHKPGLRPQARVVRVITEAEAA
jgi:cold shock CspA family protein